MDDKQDHKERILEEETLLTNPLNGVIHSEIYSSEEMGRNKAFVSYTQSTVNMLKRATNNFKGSQDLSSKEDTKLKIIKSIDENGQSNSNVTALDWH